MSITPAGRLSKQEALKSTRDALLTSLALLVPQLLEIAEITDFGSWSFGVSMFVAIVTQFMNRFFNIVRVK